MTSLQGLFPVDFELCNKSNKLKDKRIIVREVYDSSSFVLTPVEYYLFELDEYCFLKIESSIIFFDSSRVQNSSNRKLSINIYNNKRLQKNSVYCKWSGGGHQSAN